ncbi:sensor histidine kinase [Massilia sp. YIM B02763]|uniref:sensor histidine kinase n=1 Tax=Massilia sp. YIM B02763 TaxID=3050130 RepID=UPI0025B6D44D|nr:sensor histidine kinase [Massilia sp. YIM B02763]
MRTYVPGSMKDVSISAQLTLLLAGLVLAMTLAIAGILGALFTRREEVEIGQQFSDLAAQVADKLDRGLFERYREVQILANRPQLGAPEELDDKRRLFEDMQRTYPYYAWLGLTDRQGRVLMSANRLLEGVDVSHRPWFQNALKDIHLTDVHAAALLAKLLETDPAEGAPRFIDIAFPYRDRDGRLAGVFGVHLSLAWAAEIEQSVMLPLLRKRKVEAFIVTTDQTVIIGPKHLVGTRLSLPPPADPARGSQGYRTARFADGKTYLIGYAKTRGYAASPGLDWTVVVRQDIDHAYAPVFRLRGQIVAVGSAIAFVFALVAWWLARWIARPIIHLAESARRIETLASDHIDPTPAGYREIVFLRTTLQSLISQLRANESALKEANRRKDEFLATLAHELRNPLAPIATAGELLRLGRADEAQQLRLGQMIVRQTRHMTDLIDELLDVSRVTRGKIKLDRKPVDMRDVLADAIEQTAPQFAARRHRLDTHPAPCPAVVDGDRKRLVQVLANLLDNAAKFTPDGGRIVVTQTTSDGKVLLTVGDNGIGMSPQLMDHVFELFTQETRKTDLSAGGLGIGLALAKRLVELHGGTLDVASPGEGQGSTFTLALPAHALPAHAPPPAAAAALAIPCPGQGP